MPELLRVSEYDFVRRRPAPLCADLEYRRFRRYGDRENGKTPPEECDKITYDEKIDMEYLDKKIVLPEVPGQRLNAVPVKRNDIDFYHHMNNARYIEVALELLKDDAPINRVRIEYKAPAKPGDLLHPQIIEAPNSPRYVLLLDAQDKPFTIMEFS